MRYYVFYGKSNSLQHTETWVLQVCLLGDADVHHGYLLGDMELTLQLWDRRTVGGEGEEEATSYVGSRG